MAERAELDALRVLGDCGNTLEVGAGSKMNGLPVMATAAGFAANASSRAAPNAVRPAGPNEFGLVWSNPLSRVMSASTPASPGRVMSRTGVWVTTSSKAGF